MKVSDQNLMRELLEVTKSVVYSDNDTPHISEVIERAEARLESPVDPGERYNAKSIIDMCLGLVHTINDMNANATEPVIFTDSEVREHLRNVHKIA